jgi:hypothetical protein
MELKFLTCVPPWEWPPDTPELLMKTLRDPRSDASDRVIAADLAGSLTVMDDEMAGVLLSVVRNQTEPEQLRGTAAISLGPVIEATEIEGFDDVMSDPPIAKETFDEIQETLHRVFADESSPKEARRRALESSVRSPLDWHADAIRAAYSKGDEDWKLTAVFAMQWVAGFDDEIMKSLESRNPDIHREAVHAAGSREVQAAWPHVEALLTSPGTSKDLLLAAIETAAILRPRQASAILGDLVDSGDEDIAEAVEEALMMADTDLDDEEEDDEDEEDEDGGYVN